MTRLQNQVLAVPRDQVVAIMVATVFLFVGVAACAMAAIRRGSGVRLLLWQGIFSAMYGARILFHSPAGFSIFPRATWAGRDSAEACISYVILIPALLFWLEMSLGMLHRFLQVALLAAFVNGVEGVSSFYFSHSPWDFMTVNKIVVGGFLIPLAVVNTFRILAKKYMLVQSRILTAGTSIAAVVSLYENLRDPLGLPNYPAAEPLTFAVFILCLGYVAVQRVFADERRLLAIENELAIAREIQNSILPAAVPALENLRVAATYRPMTAVAGDFYEFIALDQHRAGFLIADVSGHGVPAALIAAMIKMAAQSVIAQADRPAEVLGGLNRMLSGQLHGQFVSAAYLWMDTKNRKAAYSAAGHPPLLRWRNGSLERIESNGLLIGVKPDSKYPVSELPLNSGDRFLLYTDGVTEPENSVGDSFGDGRLEQVMRESESRSASDLSDRLLSEIRRWRLSSATQQDDITFIIIDVSDVPRVGPC